MYKTKAVRKAERWAKRPTSNTLLKEYECALWYIQLVCHHGIAHANVMVADAKKAPSFRGNWYWAGCNGVVVHTETRYASDWRAVTGLNP